MNEFVEGLLRQKGYKVCPDCDGEGEFEISLGTFWDTRACERCQGIGVIEIKEKEIPNENF